MTLRRKAWIIVAAAVVALPGMLYVSLRSLSVNGCLPATALTFGLVSGLLTLLLLERSVIAHLMQFSREVERISTTGNTALRLEITGEDELSRLGQAINKMLDSIEITARANYPLVPLPEGDSYLGFIFARGEDRSFFVYDRTSA